LIGPTRLALLETGLPYVIENVAQAPIRADIELEGQYFGLKVIRKRVFEVHPFWLPNPIRVPPNGTVKAGDYASVVGKGSYKMSSDAAIPKFAQGSVVATWQYAMGIDWMSKDTDLSSSVPPAYTHYIGTQLIKFHWDSSKSQWKL